MSFKKTSKKTQMADVSTEAPEVEGAALQVAETSGLDAAFDNVSAAALAALTSATDADFRQVEESLVKFSDDPAEGVKTFRGIFVGSGMMPRRDAPPLPQLYFAAIGADGMKTPKKVNATAVLVDAFRTIKPNTPVLIEFLGEEVIGKQGETLKYFNVKELLPKASAVIGTKAKS